MNRVREQERQQRIEAARQRVQARLAKVESIIEDIHEARSRRVGQYMIGNRRQQRNAGAATF